MKPPMPYYGGKQRIAEKITAIFPSHRHYVEPFCGGLSVFLAKPPAETETLNDLDSELVTFWRVLRDRPEELIRAALLTPHARAELEHARGPIDDLDDLEIARRVWVQLTQGRAGRRSPTGWRYYVHAERWSGMDTYLGGYTARMPDAAARLAGVQLECRPALDVIERYGREPEALLYVDPPYLGSTRTRLHYVHEMASEAEHAELAEALRASTASIVLSGYRSPLYDQLYSDWNVTEIAAYTQRPGTERTEVLWCNFEPNQTLFNLTSA